MKENLIHVSVLFNESKLLKYILARVWILRIHSFSTLQRVEIAEMNHTVGAFIRHLARFSTLQRVEIAEIRSAAQITARATAFQYSSTSRNC